MVNQSAVQDIYLNQEEDMALTFENQNGEKKSTLMLFIFRYQI